MGIIVKAKKPKKKSKSKSFTKDLVYVKHGRGVKKGLKRSKGEI